MNSTAGKRYIAAQTQRIVKGDWKVFDISNANIIFEADKSWANTVAYGYNQFYCLPNKQLKYFVMNFTAVFDSLNKNNGASYNLHNRILNPDTGYMVALTGFEYIMDMPEDINKFQDAVISYCINRELWNKVASNPENTYLGFWLNEGKLYIDLAENIPSRDSAITIGHERNQIAIYDCSQRHDIRLRIC